MERRQKAASHQWPGPQTPIPEDWRWSPQEEPGRRGPRTLLRGHRDQDSATQGPGQGEPWGPALLVKVAGCSGLKRLEM